jgi:phage terminase large subunit-like protein
LDLWAREHYKSTIITFAGIIQEVIKDPEITIGIFSHTKSVAKKFLSQIKRELEGNTDLQQAFPEIFWLNPKKDSPRWAEDTGLILQRETNPKEATIEAHGLVDGMPIGAHFGLRVYDDVVTDKSVTTPEQIAKTTEAWELSDNLGSKQANGMPGRRWHIGTRYHFGDTYNTILERKALIPRIHPATEDGTPEGKPVFLTQAAWEHKKKNQGSATTACQQLQNPAAGQEALFDKDHLRFIDIRPKTLNIYIMCDPASSRKKGSDNTAMSVIGVDAALNFYLMDGYYHKMKLKERWTHFRGLRTHWMRQPGVQGVYMGYERYGMQSDIEYFEECMEREKSTFDIVELAWPREGPGSKFDRIQRLYPAFANGRFYMPQIVDGETANQKRMKEIHQSYRVFSPVRRRDHENKVYSLNKIFITEYLTYPFSSHDDFTDATSRIYDMDIRAPIIINDKQLEPEEFIDGT